MKSPKAVLATLLMAAAFSNGCIFSPGTTGPASKKPYVAPSSPYSVIQNITALYINRDFAKYDETLSQDYVFRFIPDNAGHSDSLIRNQEIDFSEHLFSTGSTDGLQAAAAKISLQIDTTSSSPDNRVGKEGWIRYYVQTNLSITLPDGQVTPVQSPAYFFFKQEPAGSGVWKLAEWQDVQTSAAPRVNPMLAFNSSPAPRD
jgi:hypothetical protein